MARLPTIGGDSGAWGTVLNEWLAKGGLAFNVKDGYGAVGDGVADDTAEITAALAAADTANAGVVFFPVGTYLTTGGHTVPEKTIVMGAGLGSKISHTGNNVCFTVNVGDGGGFWDTRAVFQGLRITGNSGASAKGVEIVDSSFTVLRDMRIDSYTGHSGLQIRNETGFSESTVIDNVHFYNNAAGIRFHRDAGGDASFSYQRFVDFKMHVMEDQIGIDFGSGGSSGGFVFGSEFSGNVWLVGDDSSAFIIRSGFLVDRCRVYLRAEDMGFTNALGILNQGTLNATGTYHSVGTINDTFAGGFVGNIEAVGSVASAATITLPSADLVTVTGTTTITSVTASVAGRRVTLVFAGILTFTDGSNLKLAGNFVTTADDAITLVSDGTNWIEVSRSVN